MNETAYKIIDDVLIIRFEVDGKQRQKRYAIVNPENNEMIVQYIKLSPAKRLCKNCEELVDAGIIHSRESLIEAML